jgi:DNA-binding FadR family transcriptional regulator
MTEPVPLDLAAERSKLVRVPLSSQIAETAQEHFIQRDIEDGATMPSAALLAEDFGVSRTVIREALAELCAKGILERSAGGRDYLVARPGAGQVTELLRYRTRRDRAKPSALGPLRDAILRQAAVTARRATLDTNASDFAERLLDLVGDPYLRIVYEGVAPLVGPPGRALRAELARVLESR